MAENSESDTQLSFKVKTSGEGLHNITIAETATVLDLKTKLSGSEYENVPVDRMRLIYAGRVMKNEEPLTTYKIKAGNTVHMVKSAASNAAATGSSAASNTSSRPAQPAVPTNMAAGTSANNPLDHLTGARYAGMIPGGLPGASMFGPDGGMGAPPSSDDMFNMMSNPQMQQMMNEMLNNPAAVDMMIQSNPMLRNMPNAREMIQSPMFRHMMTNPESIRSAMRLRSMMAGGGMGGAPSAFPAPGATNTTPDGAASTPSPGNTGSQREGEGGANPNAANPFASLLNPALFGSDPLFNPFGAQAPPYARFGAAAPTGASQGQTGASSATPATPGAPGAAASASPAGGAPSDGAPAGSQPSNASPPVNPFAALFGLPAGAGAPGSPPPDLANLLQALGGLTGGAPQAPPDNRPPEERYEQQLRQLNDMGFYDFDANVAALRRSGGSVQGAIEHLLNSP